MTNTAELAQTIAKDALLQMETRGFLRELAQKTEFLGWRAEDTAGGNVVVHEFMYRERLYDGLSDCLTLYLTENGFVCYPRAVWQIDGRQQRLPPPEQLPHGEWREIQESTLAVEYPQYTFARGKRLWSPTNVSGNLDRLAISCIGNKYQGSTFQVCPPFNPAKTLPEQQFPIWVLTFSEECIWTLALLEVLFRKDLPGCEQSKVLDTRVLLRDPVFLITALEGSVPHRAS